jgi:tRNA (cmo5U34)-methyltransferase
VSKFRFDPDTYMELMAREVPRYETLQQTIAGATSGVVATTVLDLGTGTGETLLRVLGEHPAAGAIGVDENDDMLAVARTRLEGRQVDLRIADLLDPLPAGPFDLVTSALAIHHLDGPGKAELFRRIAAALRPGGRFVLGDLVLGEDEEEPSSEDHDKPSLLADQLRWLAEAGLSPTVLWEADDLAVVSADRSG